jgi:hypothetical protein
MRNILGEGGREGGREGERERESFIRNFLCREVTMQSL